MAPVAEAQKHCRSFRDVPKARTRNPAIHTAVVSGFRIAAGAASGMTESSAPEQEERERRRPVVVPVDRAAVIRLPVGVTRAVVVALLRLRVIAVAVIVPVAGVGVVLRHGAGD